MGTILYNQLWQLKARLLCSFLLGLVTLSAQAQQPVITQASANDATPPLFTNGSISTVIEGGTGPFTYELTNAHTEDLVTSGTVGQNLTGFTRIGNYSTQTYYRSTGSYSTYEQASSAAIAQGGHLLAINSAAEQNWLTTNGGWVAGDHLGASDQNIEGTFVWSNGQPLTYTNWAPNEPNNGGGNQDYMQIYANGTWDDVSWNYTGTVRVLAEIPNDIQVDNLLPGSYLLRVTDSQGHEDTNTFEIGPGITIFNTSVSDVSCNDGGNGQVVVNLEGGVPPYTYEWSTGQSGSLPQPIEGFSLLGEFGEKIYYLSNGGFLSFDDAAALADTYFGYIASVNSEAENNWLINTGGWLTGVMVGGTDRDSEGTWTWESGEPFSYSNWGGGEPNDHGSGEDYLQILEGGNWNDVPWIQTRQVLFEFSYFVSGDQLTAGEHTLTITDNNGNQVSQTFTISEPEPFSVEFDMTPVTGCGTNGDGTVVADVDGGTPPYTYAWETGATTDNISGLDVGFYTLTTTDSNGCVFEADANVIAGDTDGPTVIAQNVVIALDENGAAELSPDDADNGTYDDCDESPELLLSRRMVIPINSSSDDVEEATNGYIYDDSSDLEFFYDGEANGGEQIIGLRFENIDLPGGTVINNAYIQFFTEDQNLDGAAPTAIIELENSTNASSFLWYENYNVSSRDYLDESVSWDMPVWDVTALSGPEQRTPDLSSLLQQIVNLDGWQQGNSVAFMLSSANPILSNLGNTAATYDENPNVAPKLVIEFASPTSEFNCSDIGEHTGYLTAVDDAGNVDFTSFNITVADTTGPVIQTQDQTLYLDENGTALTTEEELIIAITDACGEFQVGSQTLVYEVTNDNDDVEEYLSDGEMYFSSSDLELFSESGDEQIVGIRFRNIQIPEGFVVTNAHLDFEADKDSDEGETGYGFIRAELNANPSDFSYSDYNVSSRTTTNAVVPWTLTSWFEDVWYQTPDLTPLLAEVMSLPGWSNGGDMVFILQGDDDHSDTDHEAEAGPGDVHLVIEIEQTNPISFDCLNLGENAVTIERADYSDNIGSTTAIVTVVDTIKPVLSIQEAFELPLDANGSASLNPEQVDNGCTDNCGVSQMELSKTNFDCEDVGELSVSFTATDASGNVSSRQVLVTVIDNTAPTVSENISYERNIGEEGEFSLTVEDLVDYVATDACGIASEELSKTVFTCEDIGLQTITLTVTDNHGNSTVAEVTVELHDDEEPTALVQSITVELNDEGSFEITDNELNTIDNGSYDNCDIADRTLSKTTFNCDDLGENTVTFAVLDSNENSSSAEITITVEDPFAPVVEVQNVEIAITEEGAQLTIEDVEIFASDNCSIASKTLSEEFFTCEDLGSNEVTLTVTDSYGNVTERTSIVTVVDAAAPVAAPEPMTVELDENGNAQIDQETVETIIGAASYDNCGFTAITHELSKMNFDCEDLGEQIVTYTVRDAALNETSAPVTIHVVDNQAPLAQALEQTVELNENGEAFITVDMVDNGSYDNCDIADRTLSKSTFNCEDLGENTVTFAVLDSNENSSSAEIAITVEDPFAPVVEVQNVEIAITEEGAQLTIEDVEIFASDNCSIASKTLSKEFFTCEDLGSNEVTLTVTDGYGNVTERTSIVTVVDAVAPVAAPEPMTVELDENGNAQIDQETVETIIGAASYDNCGFTAITHELSKMDFDCEDLGEQIVTYTVRDAAMNETSAPVIINVVDGIAPHAQALGQTVELNENGEAFITAEMVDNGSYDNCGIADRALSKTSFTCEDLGQQIVSLTVTDTFGNTDQAVIVVTVVDAMAPVAQVTETTVYLDENGWVELNADEVITVTSENCGIADLVMSETLFNCQDVGIKSLGIDVSDAAGNIAAFETEIVVTDTIHPAFATSAIDLFLNDEGAAELSHELLMQYASDNCAIESIEADNTFFTCDADGNAQTANVTVTDVHGNVTQRQIGVFVIDAEAPDVTVNDINLDLGDDGMAVLTLDMLDMEASDNCGVASTQLSQTSFNCTDGPFTVITLTCTDFAGNSQLETFTVTINDDVTPVISGPDSFEFCEGTPVNYDGIIAEDNCQAQLLMSSGPSNGSTPEAGEYTGELIAVDAAGNVATKDVTVVIFANPTFDLGPTQYAEINTMVSIEIDPFGEGYTYEWSNGDDDPSTNIEITQSVNTVTLTVTSPQGCSFSDTVQILVDPTMNVDDAEATNEVLLYPNPTTGALAVEFNLNDAKENILINVNDLSGKTVMTETIPLARNGEQVFLDLRNLPDGCYVVNILAEQLNVSERVIKK